MFNGGFPSAASSSSFAASSRRCRWQSRLPVEAVDTSFIFYPSSCWRARSPPLCLLPLCPLPLLVAPSWQLPLSFSPLQLSLSLSLSLRPSPPSISHALSLYTPLCPRLPPSLASPWTLPNVEQLSFLLSLSLSLSPSLLLLGLLFVSLVFRLHSILASSPRHGPPHGTPLRLAGYGNNRFPCVLSCVPGIVGNYSAQPGDPLFSVPSLQVLPATLPSLYTSLFVSSTLLFPRLVDIDKTSARWMERDRLEVTPRDEYLYRSTI